MDEPLQPKWLRSTKGAPFTGIGSLEADILAVVWELDTTTVRQVYETLLERRKIAYTTVMTVMNNLVKKHLLTQDKSRIAYLYTPAIPGREVVDTVLHSVVDRLLLRPVQRRRLATARPRPRAHAGAVRRTPRLGAREVRRLIRRPTIPACAAPVGRRRSRPPQKRGSTSTPER